MFGSLISYYVMRFLRRASKSRLNRQRRELRRGLFSESLEGRALMATLQVNDNWNLVTDTNVIGTLDAGDVIDNANDSASPTSYTIGTDMVFGVVTTGVGGVTYPQNLPVSATIQSAVSFASAGEIGRAHV